MFDLGQNFSANIHGWKIHQFPFVFRRDLIGPQKLLQSFLECDFGSQVA